MIGMNGGGGGGGGELMPVFGTIDESRDMD